MASRMRKRSCLNCGAKLTIVHQPLLEDHPGRKHGDQFGPWLGGRHGHRRFCDNQCKHAWEYNDPHVDVSDAQADELSGYRPKQRNRSM